MMTNPLGVLKAGFCLLLIVVIELHANPLESLNRISDVATEFIILHNNDMHARFEQTSRSSGKCTPTLANTDQCYGGFARVAHEVRQYREEAKNGGMPVLYLNAGDTYSGTTWFSIFRDNITTAFLNKLMPDAISLGNHEFDDGVEGLLPFLNKAEFPVLVSNLDISREPELLHTKSLSNSTILNVNGVQVGVIGYLTPETKKITKKASVEFNPEIAAINREAAKLKAEGVNIIIALGHSGYHTDQEIAAECPEVDLVIGGHSNTFLYNGPQPDSEVVQGPYPTMVSQRSGKKVPVVQAYAYTKYLGKLHVQFDKNGNLLEIDGTPILLNASIPRESDILQLLEVYRPNVTELESQIVGYTKVHLEGSSQKCRSGECNLGNLIADSMVYARVKDEMGGIYWTDAPIAFIMGGGIRSSIEKRDDGAIYKSDIVDVLNHHNKLYVTKITGNTILAALERSAELVGADSDGGFLQMSGVHVVYDMHKPIGKRVHSVEVRCASCHVPDYSPLVKDQIYSVVVPEFLLQGGDGHTFLEPKTNNSLALNIKDREALEEYINKTKIVYPGIEERITFIEKKADGSGDGAFAVASSILMVLVSAVTLSVFH